MISDDCEMFTVLIAGGWSDPSRPILRQLPQGHQWYNLETAKEYVDLITGHGLHEDSLEMKKSIYTITKKDLGWLGLSSQYIDKVIMEIRLC